MVTKYQRDVDFSPLHGRWGGGGAKWLHIKCD
jgi:hypothetical protein